MQNVENLFLEVSRAFDEQDLSEAKHLLEEILMIDPGYGRAHDHLGWIYETKIKDFDKAKFHYELAIKFCEGSYPNTYINYAYLLIEYGHYDDALKIIQEAETVSGVDHAILFYQKGKIAEHQLEFLQAHRAYRKSDQLSFGKDFRELLKTEMERVRSKMNIWQKLILRLK